MSSYLRDQSSVQIQNVDCAWIKKRGCSQSIRRAALCTDKQRTRVAKKNGKALRLTLFIEDKTILGHRAGKR